MDATHLPKSTLLNVTDVLWNLQIPLLICRVYVITWVSQDHYKRTSGHRISHREYITSLQLDKPFSELRAHFQSSGLYHMNK